VSSPTRSAAAEVLSSGGKEFGEQFEDTIVRIHPKRIVSFGINDGVDGIDARSTERS
jgi:hypothetical protein